MADSSSNTHGHGRLLWNLNNMSSRVEGSRMHENLSRVVRDLLPELGTQPGVLGTRAASSIINIEEVTSVTGEPITLNNSSGGGGSLARAQQLAGRGPHSHSSHYQPYTVVNGHGHTHGNGGSNHTGRGGASAADQAADSAASLVINIGAGNFMQGSSPDHTYGDDTVPDENQNTAGSPGHAHSAETAAQAIPLRSLYRMMEGSLPFLIFLFVKIMYNHRLGILVFIGLCLTFCYSNRTLRRHIAQRALVSSSTSQDGPFVVSSTHLAWIVVFLSTNIAFLYYVFRQQQLHNSLLLSLPDFGHVDLWLLLWVIGITDFVIKFGAMILKALVALLPRPVLPHKKRGKYYMLIEHVSQFYRCIVPIVPWITFLQDDELGGPWFAYFLLVVYTICKGQHMWRQAKELKKAFGKFQVDVSYGSCPSRDDLSTSDSCCPICQDKFNEPVKLSCKHIFCEDCVSMWFDRERTCPMCRANIVDDPVWRDGTTSSNLQLF